jgi:hypothetical protein
MKPWKIAGIGIALVTATALATSVTTAYLVRGGASEPQVSAVVPGGPQPAGARVVPATPAAPRPRVLATSATAPAPRPVAVARPVAVSSVPADCATTGDRVWRVAKPGLVGGLLGAGVGAAGGAIADGGKGAGKGALIGTLAGAAAGGVYGAYKTKNECGTVIGEGNWFNGAPSAPTQHALMGGAANGITVYRAR